VADVRSLAPVVALCLLGAGACRARKGAAPATRAGHPRVVSLHDVTTEIVVALGATGQLVGVGGPVQVPDSVRLAVAAIPKVGDLESIVALKPTVVLGMAVVAQRSPELVRFLRDRGIEVWLGHPTTLDNVVDLVRDVGARVGGAPAAASLEAGLRTRMSAITPASRPPARVFVYDCCDPAFTAGGNAVLTDLIRRAGGRNIFADLATDWTKVSWEQVIARRPQLIVIHDYQFEGQGGVAEKRRRLAAIRVLADVPVTVMPLGLSLGGLRSIDGLEHLVKALREKGSEG
jgi:iron complex transport system substrate-binding protein